MRTWVEARAAISTCALATMPVRRGHVAPQNTFIDTIIRKFDGQMEVTGTLSECQAGLALPAASLLDVLRRSLPLLTRRMETPQLRIYQSYIFLSQRRPVSGREVALGTITLVHLIKPVLPAPVFLPYRFREAYGARTREKFMELSSSLMVQHLAN
ncbi:Potassium voltage-gated channel sub H member 7 [Branchiostoma belcheri]|nr:Potassium voltage-gated channel sub H member 7 [Branchiostoma belcheri]